MSEFESVEEIKKNLEVAESETKSEEESNDIVNKKIPLSERLDNAYQKLDDTERQAWSEGWRPEEFFGGKNKDGSTREFINAEEFLKRREKVLPMANDRLREMAKELEETKKIAREAQERILKAEEKGYQKALEDLEKKQREAVEMGDTEEFSKLKDAEKELIKSRIPTEENVVVENVVEETMSTNTQTPSANILNEQDQRILEDWGARNSWMRTDRKLAGYAIEAEKQLLQDKPYLSLKERLDIVEQEVKDVFHSKFGQSQSTPMYESGSNGFGSSQPKEKTFSELPANVRQQAETLMRIRGVTGEDAIKRFKANFVKNIN
jgi:hypothetical protein